MERKPKIVESGPPNPWIIGLSSLFIYPGVGHFMVKRPAQGLLVAGLFSLGLGGMLYEMWTLAGPLLKLMSGQFETPQQSPNWLRILFWIVGTTVAWVGGALHAVHLARVAPEDKAQAASDAES